MSWEAPPQTYLSGNTAGTTHVFGPVVTLVGGANVTLSGDGNKILIKGGAGGAGGTGPSIQAGTQSTDGGTVVFSNSNNVTFGMSGSSRVTASASFPVQTAFVLSASNGLGWGTNGSTVTGSYTVPVQSVQPAINLAAGTQTATSGTVAFVNSNGIVFGMSASTRITASYTVPTQSVQPGIQTIHAGLADITNGVFSFLDGQGITFGADSDLSQLTASVQTAYRGLTDGIGLNTAKTNVTWTVNSSGLSLNAGGYAGTVTGATNAFVTANTSGVSVSVGNGVTATGNLGAIAVNAATTYTSGTVVFSNSNGVTFGTNAQTITGSVNTSYRASNDAIGLNTAQTNVTWTVNSSGLSLNAGGYAGTVTGATNCSVTANTSGVSVNVSMPKLSYWENPNIDGMTSWSGTSNSISIQRIFVPAQISATRADFLLNISGSSSGALSFRVNLGLYTATQSSLNSASTTSRGFSINSTSAISYTAVSGPRSWSIGLGTWNMTPGEYFLALNMGWTTASTNTVFIAPYGNGSIAVISGGETGAFANRTDYFRSGMINNNAQSTLPDTMQISGMTQTGAAPMNQPWVAFHGTF